MRNPYEHKDTVEAGDDVFPSLRRFTDDLAEVLNEHRPPVRPERRNTSTLRLTDDQYNEMLELLKENYMPNDITKLSEDELDRRIHHYTTGIMASTDGDRITRYRRYRQPFIDEVSRRAAAIKDGSPWTFSTTFQIDISPELSGLITGDESYPTLRKVLGSRYGGTIDIGRVKYEATEDVNALSAELAALEITHDIKVMTSVAGTRTILKFALDQKQFSALLAKLL